MTHDRRHTRAEASRALAHKTGLSRILRIREARPNANEGEDYDKLFVARNSAGIRSVEVWYPARGEPYLKLTHSEKILSSWKEAFDAVGRQLTSLGSSYASRATFTRLNGDCERSMELLARKLRELDAAGTAEGPSEPAPRQAVDHAASTSAIDVGRSDGSRAREPGKLSVLHAINAEILAFSEAVENLALLPRTRSYSTPFRRSLFRKLTQEDVALQLEAGVTVDALLLMANPNNRADLEGDPRYGTLREQIDSGLFGEAYFDRDRQAVQGWSPRFDPKNGWKRVLRSIDAAGLNVENVAMANFLPWGSRDLADLVEACGPALIQRMLGFADKVFLDMVVLLRPRVIVVVRSLSETRGLEQNLLAHHRTTSRHLALSVPTLAGGTKSVNLFAGSGEFGGHRCDVVHMPHPGYLQLTKDAEPLFVRQLAELLRETGSDDQR